MNGRHIYLHRYLMNALKGTEIEFINSNSLDNRRENLRIITHARRRRTNIIGSNNTTGFKGVYLQRSTNKYKASIKHNGKLIYLGLFSTAEEASDAYNQKAKDLIERR